MGGSIPQSASIPCYITRVSDGADREQKLGLLNQGFRKMVPHNDALGIEFIDFGPGTATLRLPWAEHLVGNPETGVVHGGVVTSLLDACSGAAVFMKLLAPTPIATLDLRIDYLRPATPREPLFAKAECYKLTRNVAFVRAIAHHGDESDPVASATSTFMVRTRGKAVLQEAARKVTDP
jgi:uncharacterized protein (TIGR00369 family)